MRRYTQLTRGKRYQIRALLKAGFSRSQIAFYLKVHKSTISREIRRNQGHKGYRPVQAHEKAMVRRFAAAKRIKMTPAMVELIDEYICRDFSPEQVSGYLERYWGQVWTLDRSRLFIILSIFLLSFLSFSIL